jgi:hypothetical protein
VYISGFSEALGTNKPRDLGIKVDPAQFNALAKENVTLTGQTSDFYLTAPIRYGSAVPMVATVSSEEITSMMRAINNVKGPLKNMQVNSARVTKWRCLLLLTWKHTDILSRARYTSKVHFFKRQLIGCKYKHKGR